LNPNGNPFHSRICVVVGVAYGLLLLFIMMDVLDGEVEGNPWKIEEEDEVHRK